MVEILRLAETEQFLQQALDAGGGIKILAAHDMSGDPDQEYFADGLVEDIITGLSQIGRASCRERV